MKVPKFPVVLQGGDGNDRTTGKLNINPRGMKQEIQLSEKEEEKKFLPGLCRLNGDWNLD